MDSYLKIVQNNLRIGISWLRFIGLLKYVGINEFMSHCSTHQLSHNSSFLLLPIRSGYRGGNITRMENVLCVLQNLKSNQGYEFKVQVQKHNNWYLLVVHYWYAFKEHKTKKFPLVQTLQIVFETKVTVYFLSLLHGSSPFLSCWFCTGNMISFTPRVSPGRKVLTNKQRI